MRLQNLAFSVQIDTEKLEEMNLAIKNAIFKVGKDAEKLSRITESLSAITENQLSAYKGLDLSNISEALRIASRLKVDNPYSSKMTDYLYRSIIK